MVVKGVDVKVRGRVVEGRFIGSIDLRKSRRFFVYEKKCCVK